jgi:NAD(P)H-flavin reductase
LTARQRVGKSIAFEVEIDDLQQFVAAFSAGLSLDAVGSCKKFEVFENLHVIVHAEKIWHVADEPANFTRVLVDGVPADVGFAMRGFKQRGNNPHGCGFTGTVGSDETVDITLVQLHVDVFDGEEVAVLFGQVYRSDHDFDSNM